MKLKYIVSALVLAGCLAVGGSAFAQGPPGGPGGRPGGQMMGRGPGGRGMKMEDDIFKQLKLTSKQKAKVDAARKWRMDTMRSMFPRRGQGGPGAGSRPPGPPPANGQRPGGMRRQMDPALRAKFEGVRTQYEAKIKKALTTSQYKKYHSLMEAERAKRMKMRPGGPPRAA